MPSQARDLKKRICLRPIGATLICLLVPVLYSTSASAELANYWLSKAEEACLVEEHYTVERKTRQYRDKRQQHQPRQSPAAPKDRRLVKSSSTRLSNSRERGLRPMQKSGALAGARARQTGADQPPTSLTVDVGRMLKRMKGRASWELEGENIQVAGEPAAVISSSGPGWLVKLWIRQRDGAVLRYEQYLNGELISTTDFQYEVRRGKKRLPRRSATSLHKGGITVVQDYEEYDFSPTD